MFRTFLATAAAIAFGLPAAEISVGAVVGAGLDLGAYAADARP